MFTISNAPGLKVPSRTWWTPTKRTAAKPIAVTTPTIRLYTPPSTRTVLVEGGVYSLIVGVVTAIGLAAVLFVGVHHVLDGTLSLGALLMVNIYLTQLYSPLKDMGKKVLDVQMSLAGMERFLQILDEQPDVPEKRNARRIRRAKGRIAFRDVSFGYDKDHLVLRHVSFELSPGI